ALNLGQPVLDRPCWLVWRRVNLSPVAAAVRQQQLECRDEAVLSYALALLEPVPGCRVESCLPVGVCLGGVLAHPFGADAGCEARALFVCHVHAPQPDRNT